MDVTNNFKLRIGVLVPGSGFVPFLADDLLTAVKSGLDKSQTDAEIITEFCGFNADLKMLTPAIQKLILVNRVDCIIAPLNVSIIEEISGLCESQKIPLIALNLTEDPLFLSAANPYVFVNSYYLWHCAWMSGYLGGKRFGPRGSGLLALHEGGYGLMFAFQLGLEAARGNLVQACVTHRDSSRDDPTEYIADTVSHNPDFIWIAYSGKESKSFLTVYRQMGVADKIQTITIPTILNSNIRQTEEENARGIWCLTADGPQEKSENSKDKVTEINNRPINPYALLAYESVNLISTAVAGVENRENFAADFHKSLKTAEFESTRGKVSFNQDFDKDIFYLNQFTESGVEYIQVDAPPLLFEQYRLACKNLAKKGWVNPYLCA